jgi:imidazolonepropionase-like amidohydrolase
MRIFKIAITAIIGLISLQMVAQNPVPAPPQINTICITGATAHLGNGRVIENSLIVFEKGKITSVGTYDGTEDFSEYQVIDASGKHLYPGFIAANTNLGLVEIGAVRSTRDATEVGSLNPNVRSIIAYNTDSEIIPTVRNHGILTAQICPQGGSVSGSSSIVHLDGWNWEDAAIKTDDGIHLNWPGQYTFNRRTRTRTKDRNYAENIRNIQSLFEEAKAYNKGDKKQPKNLKLEAMNGLFQKTQKLFIHANDAASISQAVILAKKYDLDVVIVGGRDAWRITDLLKDNDVSVILERTQRLPQRADEDIDQPFKTPALLEAAGITYGISMGGNWTVRNLPYQAGQAIGFGLEYEKAVMSISANVAKILGLDDRLGTIESGKDATFFLSTGDALDMRSSTVEMAFIQGRQIDLEDKQKYLYRKFSKKYKPRD